MLSLKLLAQSIRSHLTMPVLFSGDSSGDFPWICTQKRYSGLAVVRAGKKWHPPLAVQIVEKINAPDTGSLFGPAGAYEQEFTASCAIAGSNEPAAVTFVIEIHTDRNYREYYFNNGF